MKFHLPGDQTHFEIRQKAQSHSQSSKGKGSKSMKVVAPSKPKKNLPKSLAETRWFTLS